MPDEVIQILIGGKAYALRANDPDSLKKLPWSDRKQLIELLENIKQAEYVKTSQPANEVSSKLQTNTDSPINKHHDPTKSVSFNGAGLNQASPKKANKISLGSQFDPSIKPSDKDADDMMARLILDQKQHQKSIPDKSSVLKFMLVVFAVIIALMLIF